MTNPIPAKALDQFQVHMIYRTEEGREATVVFTGSEDAYDCELSPLHDGIGGVRIGYLTADGAETDPLSTEFAFYTGDLTPVRWLRTPTRVEFKDEGDLDGEPVGPMGVFFAHETRTRLRRYDPSRRRAPWVPRSQAEQFATSLGLDLIAS